MNIFRFLADLVHVASIVLLILKIYASKSVSGISMKTQELYLIVFVTRYLDLIFGPHMLTPLHIYNSIMKIIFISTAAGILYYSLKKEPYKSTYKAKEDSFLHYKFLVLPCLILAFVFPNRYEVMEILWTFSIYLESVAILPQLILIQRYGNVENLTANYIFALGSYRALYVGSWLYNIFTINSYLSTPVHYIPLAAGVVQTALYCDFFYYYFQARMSGRTMLPR